MRASVFLVLLPTLTLPDDHVKAARLDPLRRIVDECNRKAIEDFKKGDMLAVARGYADDATIYFPRGKKVHGREAIDRYWQSLKGAKDWKLETVEVGGTAQEMADWLGGMHHVDRLPLQFNGKSLGVWAVAVGAEEHDDIVIRRPAASDAVPVSKFSD